MCAAASRFCTRLSINGWLATDVRGQRTMDVVLFRGRSAWICVETFQTWMHESTAKAGHTVTTYGAILVLCVHWQRR